MYSGLFTYRRNAVTDIDLLPHQPLYRQRATMQGLPQPPLCPPGLSTRPILPPGLPPPSPRPRTPNTHPNRTTNAPPQYKPTNTAPIPAHLRVPGIVSSDDYPHRRRNPTPPPCSTPHPLQMTPNPQKSGPARTPTLHPFYKSEP